MGVSCFAHFFSSSSATMYYRICLCKNYHSFSDVRAYCPECWQNERRGKSAILTFKKTNGKISHFSYLKNNCPITTYNIHTIEYKRHLLYARNHKALCNNEKFHTGGTSFREGSFRGRGDISDFLFAQKCFTTHISPTKGNCQKYFGGN
jgi:hypothetical protein